MLQRPPSRGPKKGPKRAPSRGPRGYSVGALHGRLALIPALLFTKSAGNFFTFGAQIKEKLRQKSRAKFLLKHGQVKKILPKKI